MKFYKLLAVLITFITVLSCSNDNMSNDTQYHKTEKTETQLNKKNTIVTTTNVSTDFGRSNILIAKGVKLINGEIINKSNLDLWYIPYDFNLEPVIIQSKTDSCGNKPLLECACPGGTVAQQATCGFASTDNGDGTCSTTCEGVTCCKMVVTAECTEGKNPFKISGILNGVIVAAEMITFNNKQYTSI